MGDQRIASKNFNPYDLGSVARATKEFRANGQYRSSQNGPYVPPKQDETSSARREAEPGKTSKP
jgi:hypothetical protein